MAAAKNNASCSAPLKDVCGLCAARFYSKQQYLAYSASCDRRFHCKCLDVGLEEYSEFMETGTSTFKCFGCTRRCSLSPNSAGDSASTDNDILNAPEGESAAAQERLFILASSMYVIDNMAKQARNSNASVRKSEVFFLKLCSCARTFWTKFYYHRRHSRRLLPSPQMSRTLRHPKLLLLLCQHSCR